MTAPKLLAPDEPNPVAIAHENGASPFFRSVVSNLEMVLAKSSLPIAARYAELVADQALAGRVFSRIEAEWRASREAVLEAMQRRLDVMPDAMAVRRATVEHVFGTLKAWMGSTPFLTKGLKGVRTEMSLAILAYNVKRMIRLFGAAELIQAIRV